MESVHALSVCSVFSFQLPPMVPICLLMSPSLSMVSCWTLLGVTQPKTGSYTCP